MRSRRPPARKWPRIVAAAGKGLERDRPARPEELPALVVEVEIP
jgi:hypothetical protein